MSIINFMLGNLIENTKIRVMIADDVVEMRRSTRLMLTLVPDLEVVAIVKDGQQAVEMIHNPQANIEIALMDINMPRMNGITAVRLMLEHNPELACIIISAERDRKNLKAAKEIGALGYLVKPYTTEQFINLMERVVTHVRKRREQNLSPDEQRHLERQQRLFALAELYSRERRTDKKAVRLYERLASDQNCEPRWLHTLAMMYVMRQEWKRLQQLAGRLAQMKAKSPPPQKNLPIPMHTPFG